MTPKIIELDHLDATIRDALKKLLGNNVPAVHGPIVNGIIINQHDLAGRDPLQIAQEITSKINVPQGLKLTPSASPIGQGKIIVGFNIGPRL